MHTYSINSNERISVLGFLGILSVGIIWSLHKYLPNGFPVPSVFALFSGLVFIFNKWGWRWGICQYTFINTPNISGKWEMISESSIMNEAEYRALLTVKQTWTSIYLFMDGEKATSESVMAGIEIKTNDLFYIKWEYRAEYKPMFTEGNEMHYGITKLMMKPKTDPEKMEGNYYTDASRGSHGPITLIKIKKA